MTKAQFLSKRGRERGRAGGGAREGGASDGRGDSRAVYRTKAGAGGSSTKGNIGNKDEIKGYMPRGASGQLATGGGAAEIARKSTFPPDWAVFRRNASRVRNCDQYTDQTGAGRQNLLKRAPVAVCAHVSPRVRTQMRRANSIHVAVCACSRIVVYMWSAWSRGMPWHSGADFFRLGWCK